MDDRPEILMLSPFMPLVVEEAERRFRLRRLWEEGDRDAFLAREGGRIRGLAVGGERIDATLLDRLPALEIAASFGVGYDNVDVAHAAARGVVVTNTPDVLTEEVADLAVGLLLATLRRIPQADRYLREGRWLEAPFPLSPTLRGRRIGILGLGRIGRAIARRLDAFGVEVVYHGRRAQPDAGRPYYPSLLEMARDVDVLVAVAPGGPQTRRIVDAAVLDALGPGGAFVNVGRGGVVDEPALVEALREGRILCAGLDVFEDEPRVPAELVALDNVVLLPHVGSASVETRAAMGRLVIDNLASWFAGRGPLTPTPETPVPAR